MLSNEEILSLINDKESDRIERTTSTTDTDKFAEVICAFSNDMANHKKPGDGETIYNTDYEKYKNIGGIKLSQTETDIIGIVKAYENIKVDEICKLLKISKRTAERHISHLKELKIIEYVGAFKTGGYKVKSKS